MHIKYAALLILVNISSILQRTSAFTPTKNMKLLSQFLDYEFDEHKTNSETFTHEDILRRGLARSIAKYFRARQAESKLSEPRTTVDLAKSDDIYAKNINELYKDYMSDQDYKLITECDLELENVISVLSNWVQSVDFDEATKDLPYAHFDANTFVESNRHVAKLMKNIIEQILIHKNFATARKFIGQVLHTIADFYSHTNWIEMGHADKINEKIGSSDNDLGVQVVSGGSADGLSDCFSENCTRQVIKCKYLAGFSIINKEFGLHLPLECPIVFYKCRDNVRTDKLTSGYYTGQRAEDQDVVKPRTSGKCSHGGYLDKTSIELPAFGGINKDTAYYFLSPRADLHVTAAELAVKHTEKFFDNLRARIGNENYDELLQLLHTGQNSKVYCFFKRLISK
jgi:hypothetical protein